MECVGTIDLEGVVVPGASARGVDVMLVQHEVIIVCIANIDARPLRE